MVDPIIFILITVLGIGLGIKVTSTQNPVYSGLYLVLVFFLGSGIAFLLGLEFIGLLFLLVYAGAIAVLVLFVVMMLDVKAIENPWSAKKKRILYGGVSIFLFSLLVMGLSDEFPKIFSGFLLSLFYLSFGKSFTSDNNFTNLMEKNSGSYDGLGGNRMWFIEFDTSCALNDPSYLLYSTYAILLIIAGVILLIAMIGAISLTLQKNCPESLYRQLGRESKNAVFLIKEKNSFKGIDSGSLS